MASVTPPYFFDEFLLPVKRKTPSARELALGFTVKDLDWLNTLYYATDAARKDPTVHKYPMQAEKLLISLTGKPAIVLAGAFMLSPTPDAAKAVLYTPYGGLEVFDSRSLLLEAVQTRLKQPSQRAELLHFVSIAEREALPSDSSLAVSAAAIPGAVLVDQEQAILAAQQKNVLAMLDQLREMPNLYGMLDTLLGIMARSHFPGLNQRDTRVDFYIRAAEGENPRWVASMPLRDALLRFYATQGWPKDQTHEFSNIGRDTHAFTATQRAEDKQLWDSVVEQTSGILSKLLHSLLQTYWNEDFNAGQSRRSFFAQAMSDKFRVDLLLKHQAAILSTEESQALRAIFLADHTARIAEPQPLRVEKVRVHAPYQHYVELAGTLMLSNDKAYLYTQSRGLQILKNLDDLNDALRTMLKTAGHEDELLNFLSLDERSVFIGLDQLHVTGQPVMGNVFQEMVEDICTKQFNNMEYALGLYRRNEGGIDLAALLDSVLDVRIMLDSRLLEQDADGRWSVHPITTGGGQPSTVQAEKARQQLQSVQAVDTALALERSKHPTFRDLAAHALDAQLAQKHLALKADEVHINTYPTPAQELERRVPTTSVSMVEHFIERLARQADALTQSTHSWFYGNRNAGAAPKLHNLTHALFNDIIDKVLDTFVHHDLHSLPHVLLDNNRSHLSQGMLHGLSGEAELRRLSKTLPPAHLGLLGTVLNAESMTRLTRHGLNGFIPDAFGMTLHVGANTIAHTLANCFVLTERGGTDPLNSGAALLWTVAGGYEAFASVKALRDELGTRLQDEQARMPLIAQLPISIRQPHQLFELGPLQRIDDHLLDNRQQTYADVVADEIRHLLSMKLSARRIQDCMDALIRRAPPSNLGRTIHIAQALSNQQALPPWLGMAAPSEQILQAELLEQYRLSAPDERDYVHSITPLREKVVNTLTTLLEARFPGQAISPDNVLIPARIDLQGNSQTLTDFALRHLPELNADNLRPKSRTATALPPALDGNAVVQLVRQLDLSSIYRALLATHLAGQGDDTRARRQLYCRQLPWQLLQYAHEQKLDERLSGAAWGFIRQVFDMPDGVARATVRGVSAIIRPLELIATVGAVPALALGCYLIGPQAGASGPLVLYAPYSAKHVLKEYADEAALLTEFTTPGVLQEWVLAQLADPHQATYRNLLQQQWRRQSSEILLGMSPITGNLLNRLFRDNTEMLQRMLNCQFVSWGKRQWDAVTSLLTQEIPKGLAFMAGKLAYPLVVWRSYKLFKASAEDLQAHRWRHAMKAFIAGVAQLASLRGALDKLFPDAPPAEQPMALDQWLNAAATIRTTLDEQSLAGPQRTQLQGFEDHDVALDSMTRSTLTHVYHHQARVLDFVPVGGKVYPVKKAGIRWCIANATQQGPYVQRNALGEWVLDLDRHHPRYGKTLSRYSAQLATRTAERSNINIEAVGMQEIAALSSWKAQCINEALNVATYYAVNCKRNLIHFAIHRDPNSRLGRFFSELFGVITLTPEQVQRAERRVDEVLSELVNHTLTSPDSRRFVCGTHRVDPQYTFAFMLPDDAEQKIYLLDRFFDPPIDIYQNRLTSPFNLTAHARASTLIHEISHLKSATEDLAYLDSIRPFHDLINVNIAGAAAMKTALSDLRETALSTLTPATVLFKAWDDFSQQWEDFGSSRATTPQKDKILSITGARTLNDARSIFMSNPDKRIDTILANADSVTYLITQLGRELDTGA